MFTPGGRWPEPGDELACLAVLVTVNIASRLEGQTKRLQTPLLVSPAVAEQLMDPHGLRIEPVQEVQLKGVEGAFMVRSIVAEGFIDALQQPAAQF